MSIYLSILIFVTSKLVCMYSAAHLAWLHILENYMHYLRVLNWAIVNSALVFNLKKQYAMLITIAIIFSPRFISTAFLTDYFEI